MSGFKGRQADLMEFQILSRLNHNAVLGLGWTSQVHFFSSLPFSVTSLWDGHTSDRPQREPEQGINEASYEWHFANCWSPIKADSHTYCWQCVYWVNLVEFSSRFQLVYSHRPVCLGRITARELPQRWTRSWQLCRRRTKTTQAASRESTSRRELKIDNEETGEANTGYFHMNLQSLVALIISWSQGERVRLSVHRATAGCTHLSSASFVHKTNACFTSIGHRAPC